MSGTTYSNYMAPAFVGMKADSMDDNVDTFVCGSVNVDVGVAVQRTAAGALTCKNGASVTLGVGVALHDHVIGYYGNYRQYDAISVLTRGRAWVKVSDATAVADGAACKASATTGEFSTTGAIAVTNAVFRSAAISLLNVDGVTTTLGAVVELHNPNV
jgi:hypothetical protein